MVSRLRARNAGHRQERRKARKRTASGVAFNVITAVLIIAVYALKLDNYVDPASLQPLEIEQTAVTAIHDTVSAIGNLPFLNTCPRGLTMRDVSGGYVCLTGAQRGPYMKIYNSYPLVGGGREAIYSSTDEGSIAAADDLMHNQVDLPRYRPVRLSPQVMWSEDPRSAPYWRFEFYSLRPTLNLLYAYRTTGRAGYARKLLELVSSFIGAENRSRWAWVNPHAVAFRCMALVDTWWKLRQLHSLPEADSTAILGELEKTGLYLADPNYYQQAENHGANEAAALYELAVAFPTLPNARKWLALAEDRFRWQLRGIIDKNGQLIENSPFYDFYILGKYWQIYSYSEAHGYPISGDFQPRLRRMLNFATYILQPNSTVPVLGASITAKINYYGEYRSMSALSPELQYVLTHGDIGTRPPENSIYFRASNLTIMRSDWGTGAQFGRSTYLTFYGGVYRTAHSDLDALDLTLYGDGGDLLTDPGLYTYAQGRYHDYFHGTASHNTVTVDGKSQVRGSGTLQPLVTKDGVTYQSAESSLYRGVSHQRMVMMIDPDHILVVDRLTSDKVHTYRQEFHLFPGAKLSKSGLTVSGSGGTPRRELTIQQLRPAGVAESDTINRRGRRLGGLCSVNYEQLVPCHAVAYSVRAKEASFVTLLTIGPPHRTGFTARTSDGGRRLRVEDGSRDLSIALGESRSADATARATDSAPPPVSLTSVRAALTAGQWAAAGTGSVAAGRASDDADHAEVRLSDGGGSASMQNDTVRLDLMHRNARLRLKITGRNRLTGLRLLLSNDHWAKSMSMNLLSAYPADNAKDWVNLFLSPGGRWGQQGGWSGSGAGFNWSKIDGIKIEADAGGSGHPAAVSLDGLWTLPAQREGKLVFVFDDGYQSILPAARYLHENAMKGNVAVIGKYVDIPTNDYLNMFQLKALQDNWGWDMVNHSQRDVDAVRHYYRRNDLEGYATDIAEQATWLEANHMNSAPNWFIYPMGTANAATERVVARYYMFARVTADNPDTYPFGISRAVTDLEIRYQGDGQGDRVGSRPSAVISAVSQAVKYHQTIILTFRRIKSMAGDLTGYPLAAFKKIVDGIRQSGIKVMTLSELDRSNGIPVRNRIDFTPARPAQITVNVTSGPSDRRSPAPWPIRVGIPR
jgi:hypothetical protein